MAKRVTSKKVLEWVSERVSAAAGATNVRQVIALNLDDDELAEIHRIESEIEVVRSALVDDNVDAQLMLSMDPSASIASDPYDEVQYEDLETVYNHRFIQEVTVDDTAASIDQNLISGGEKSVDFNVYPILLATNPSVVVSPDADLTTTFHIRLWFTRRRAVGNELARTLLKRR